VDILLVDDEPEAGSVLGRFLRDAGHRLTLATGSEEATAVTSARVFDVVICDIRLPRVDGHALLRHVRRESPTTDVIMVTAQASIAEAVLALKEGAFDFLAKPLVGDELVLRLERIAEKRALRSQLNEARAQLVGRQPSTVIVGRSPSMARLVGRIDTIAVSDAPVLITGETGTGKELVARTLHRLSGRRDGPFVAVNCAAFPESLLEAELFGHERGAFTGAVRKRDGRFKAADGGTLLLDEIAEIPPAAQAKLLRVLQEGAVEPLGTNTAVRVDVRVISATHRNLAELIAENRFREDLYYRLNVLDLEIPPLRERQGDLALLVQHFVRSFMPAGAEPPGISPRAWAALSGHSFPGNVRELAHAIEHAVVLARGGEIDLEHLPATFAGAVPEHAIGNGGQRSLAVAIKEFERQYLLRTLHLAGSSRKQAAQILGISRKNLWQKLRSHGILDEELEA
jgi:two-component system response regulator HydG/two-component system response regulator AtoC